MQVFQEAERALKISKRKDYYKALGVDPSASSRDIKRVSPAQRSASAPAFSTGSPLSLVDRISDWAHFTVSNAHFLPGRRSGAPWALELDLQTL